MTGRLRLTLGTVLAALLLTAAPAPQAAETAAGPAAPVPLAASCAGVWVIVDYGSRGGSSTRCSGSYGTGAQALAGAGFPVGRKGGLVCTINAVPDPCAITVSAYWSYWHAKRRSDGSYGAWTYSNLGADSYRPARGDAEGWVFGNGRTPPGPRPPRITVSSPRPSARPTAAKPRPTAKASRPGTPARTSQPRATGTATRKPAVSPTQAPAPTSASPASTPAPSPTGSAVVAEPGAAPPASDRGSPAGLIVTTVVLVVGAAALAGTRWTKRRG